MTPDEIKQRLADAGLMVRPLVWYEWLKCKGWSAHVFGSQYVIRADKGAFWLEGRNIRTRFLTHTAAQKHAEADYARRIYDALQEIDNDPT